MNPNRQTAFENGYGARGRGERAESNPYDFDVEPYSFRRWNDGWKTKDRELRA